ncbi:uncharacterized protein METZ01_LOCUS83592 [marine metagenome]|uniref:Large polyvalent protein associated domain-containing protein n=1 Tax=marine metagenome TaxID=408172 RepID=A0A381USY8_9ZZZZ
MPSTDIKDYWRRSWGIGDRVGFQNNPLKNFENIYTSKSGAQLSNVKNEKLGFIYPHKTKEGEIKWRKTRSELKGKYDFTKEPPIEVAKTNRYKFDIDKNKWVYKARGDVIGDVDMIQKSGETFKQFHKRLQNISADKVKKARSILAEAGLETRKTIDTWTKNWLDKNLSKYKVRDQKKFINDLRKDYKAFVKKDFSNKSKIGQVNLFSKDGLPNLSRSIGEAGTSIFEYEGFKTVDLGQRGSTPVKKNPTKWLSYESLLRKIFYKNKIRTDPKLFNNIKEYFNFITTNKRAVEGRELMKNFKPDPDVLYLLDSTKSKLDNAPKGDIFSSFGDEFKASYENYRHKMLRGERWRRNAKIIEDTLGKNEIKRLTGADTIKLAMDREGRALKKIFDFTKLPEDLKLSYTLDHGQGIAAAVKSGNKNIMRLAVTDLIGTTAQANEKLGLSSTGNEAFETKRSKLVQAIVEGDTSKLKDLNEITEKAYGKKNVYKIVNGELISSRVSSAKDAQGRYKQYIEKIAKIPVAKKEIIKQSKINPELKKIVKFLNVEDSSKLRTVIQSIMSKKNSGLNVVDIAKWGSAELSALDDIAGKIPSKALGAFGKLLKFAGVVAIPVDAVPFTHAHSTGLTPDVGAMNLAEMYSNLPGMIWEAGEWVASKVQGKEHEWKPFYEFEFGRDYETKKLQKTPLPVLEKRVDRWATDMVPQEDLEQVSSYLDRRGIPGITDENVQLQQYEAELLKRMREKKALADQKKKEERLTGVDKYILSNLDV